ncbi:BlaI/MecI/CopY family transcriptional regulator [Frigoriflavimonas asaccharolytica]|uniref:Putative transcriptional regulator n=1 Tax=Frigoriflavimonas asaccharolytica TaxID=2735899 RepID=A0A8J8KAH4_9FLAO|nr:BlaI/MecI/CopY family transcriptional regulator [Frigoriflavimonas asaccharolytica]NRS91489.1 putative transcriptional regulator [Frigoriflavimonas asaccharolytica]
MNDLTNTEEMIMMVIWSLDSAYLKDIMEAQINPKPHQNTVSTYLKILREKKFVSTKKEGRIFKYYVEISYEDYKSHLINQLLEKHFDDSSLAMVQKMILDKTLKTDDLKNIFKSDGDLKKKKKKSEIENLEIADFIKTITEPKKKKKKKSKN